MEHIYSRLKLFHYQEKIDSLEASNDKILPPVHVRVKPTNVCAHNCWYCAYRVENLQLGKDMVVRDSIPKEKMMEIIDDFNDMGVKALTFSGGGDPFYYAHLLETVKKLSKTSVQFASLTNGARLTGEIAEVFSFHGTWLRVSIDGWDDQSYAKYRRIKEGEFTKVMTNLENFKKIGGKCYLGISLIIDRDNASHIFEFVTRLKNIGVDSVKMSPVLVSNDGNESNDYHAPIRQLVRDQIAKAREALVDKTFELFDSYHEQLSTFKKEYHWCPFIQVLPVIGADLNVYSCHDKAYNLDSGIIGSIKDQSFKKFWMEDKSKFFKINPAVHCNHHCVNDSSNRYVLDYLNANKEHLAFV